MVHFLLHLPLASRIKRLSSSTGDSTRSVSSPLAPDQSDSPYIPMIERAPLDALRRSGCVFMNHMDRKHWELLAVWRSAASAYSCGGIHSATLVKRRPLRRPEATPPYDHVLSRAASLWTTLQSGYGLSCAITFLYYVTGHRTVLALRTPVAHESRPLV